eukprot:TRINITY_DN28488_c0_g1_i1.p1 TRINITY_DN28488_c0_g1~~TRINITY_DN28488_c0_g1_i1.p1  ORF type:complete len:879 (+),score=300.11 TRINITY_DN28488_c0_g1_i1:67-2703(+)
MVMWSGVKKSVTNVTAGDKDVAASPPSRPSILSNLVKGNSSLNEVHHSLAEHETSLKTLKQQVQELSPLTDLYEALRKELDELAQQLRPASSKAAKEVGELKDSITKLEDGLSDCKALGKTTAGEVKKLGQELRIATLRKVSRDPLAASGLSPSSPSTPARVPSRRGSGHSNHSGSGRGISPKKPSKEITVPAPPAVPAIKLIPPPGSGRAAQRKKSADDRGRDAVTGEPLMGLVWQKLVPRIQQVAFQRTGAKVDDKFWKRLDRDGSGQVSLREFVTTILRKEFGLSLKDFPDEAAIKAFKEIDENETGYTTFQDLAAALEAVETGRSFRAVRDPPPGSQPGEEVDVPMEHIVKVMIRLQSAAREDGGNGQLDEDFFKRLDRNNTGGMSVTDWIGACRKFLKIPTTELTDEDLTKVFKRIDLDRSGTLEVSELVDLAKAFPVGDLTTKKKNKKLVPSPELPSAVISKLISRLKQCAYHPGGIKFNEAFFSKVDQEGRGHLNLKEFHGVVRRDCKLAKSEVTDEQIRDIFQQLDDNESGRLDVQELEDLARKVNEFQNPGLAAMLEQAAGLHMALQIAGIKHQKNCDSKKKSPTGYFSPSFRKWMEEIPPGIRVQVTGLIARADLNGQEGTVVVFDDEDFRYKVCMDDGSLLQFAHKNLKRLDLPKTPKGSNQGSPRNSPRGSALLKQTSKSAPASPAGSPVTDGLAVPDGKKRGGSGQGTPTGGSRRGSRRSSASTKSGGGAKNGDGKQPSDMLKKVRTAVNTVIAAQRLKNGVDGKRPKKIKRAPASSSSESEAGDRPARAPAGKKVAAGAATSTAAAVAATSNNKAEAVKKKEEASKEPEVEDDEEEDEDNEEEEDGAEDEEGEEEEAEESEAED